MPRHLYLFERIDVVGQGAYAYMEHLKKDPVLQMPDMFTLQGTFYVVGITGRWPEVVNIWDVPGGWDGWRANVDRLNLKRKKAFYEDWWDEAAQWRSSGFDRLCAAIDGSPTTDEIRERGIRGTLFMNELTRVRPGAQLDYLAAVREQRVPIMADHGYTPTGLWQVLWTPTEVITVWATEVDAHVRLQQARDVAAGHLTVEEAGGVEGDPRILEWERTALEFVTDSREELMTPCPGMVYSPTDYEDPGDWAQHIPGHDSP